MLSILALLMTAAPAGPVVAERAATRDPLVERAAAKLSVAARAADGGLPLDGATRPRGRRPAQECSTR